MTAQDGDRRPGIVGRSRELIEGAVNHLKPRDMAAAVDEFTAEMTLVLEGLSQDVDQAREELAQLSAAATISEEALRGAEQRLNRIEKRLEALDKRMDKQQHKRATLSTVLRQVTVIAAIIGGVWVLTALLRLLGG